jgi:Tol biopolymer transport system component
MVGLRLVLAWLVAVAALLAIGPTTSEATFPAGTAGKIAFSRAQGGQTNLWLMNPDGSGQLNLTSGLASTFETQPVFSPDGQRLAYISEADVFVIGSDGSSPTNLTNSSAPEEQDPDFSPDGRRIAFARFDGPAAEILTVNADGSGLTPITQTTEVSESQPSFSPDGRRIAFTRSVAGSADIWVMNADGTGQGPLTSTAQTDSDPSFSHDGSRIVFRRDGDLWVMNADGSGELQLTNTPGGMSQETDPVFSPDDQQILFTLFNGMSGELYLRDAAGSQTNLTNTPTPVSEQQPDWEAVYTCGGRRATLIGTDSADVIKGTKAADVIVGNGGNDKLVGRAGKDRLCGGGGKDKLKGGAGNDRLFGGAGKDKLAGAKGRDKCAGGAGRDKATACEKGKL